MPAGGTAMGFAYFGIVKLAGYTTATAFFKNGFDEPSDHSVFKLGLARTAIGLAIGTAYGGVWLLLQKFLPQLSKMDLLPVLFYFLILFPIRLFEWRLLFRVFFPKATAGKKFKYSMIGTFVSYVLDAIGMVAAFVIPGGFWIC